MSGVMEERVMLMEKLMDFGDLQEVGYLVYQLELVHR